MTKKKQPVRESSAKGGWIKVRASLLQSPKLIAVACSLREGDQFWEWLGCEDMKDDALRVVTLGLLTRVWSAAREHGSMLGDDLLLPHISIRGLDSMGGAPGLGTAMAAVGWAVNSPEQGGVIFPDFAIYNIVLSGAERTANWRERRDVTLGDVSRVEESRVENKDQEPPKAPRKRGAVSLADIEWPSTWDEERDGGPFAALAEWLEYRRDMGKPVKSAAQLRQLAARYADSPAELARDLRYSMSNGWQGVFSPEGQKPSQEDNLSAAQLLAIADKWDRENL